MQIYKSKKKLVPPAKSWLRPGNAPVVCSKLLLTYLPSYRFWGPLGIKSAGIKIPPPPRYAYSLELV